MRDEVVFWVGEGGVNVWWNVFVVKDVAVVFCEFFEWYAYVFGVLLF
jgi:hypothetical protein